MTACARVTMPRNALPAAVRGRVRDRIAWLEAQLPALDAEMAAPCCPLVVRPACWFGVFGNERHLLAGRIQLSSAEGRQRFVVELPATVLLEYDDDFVLGVIAHEFLHVVYATVQQVRSRRFTEWFGVAMPTESVVGYHTSFGSYRKADARLQALPEHWLSERLQRLQARAEWEPQDEAERRVRRHWIAKGFPVETLPPGEMCQPDATLWLDPAIVARQDALMLAKVRA